LTAVKVPLETIVYPVLTEAGWSLPQWLGNYNPVMVLGLTLMAFLPGLILYQLIKNVRYDEIYLGGMEALEKFRISGTGWYNEIRNMRPLKGIYSAAEFKIFDIYNWSLNISKALGKILSWLHTGQLQFYNLWIIIGVLFLFWMI
jgi:hypothetical protein